MFLYRTQLCLRFALALIFHLASHTANAGEEVVDKAEQSEKHLVSAPCVTCCQPRIVKHTPPKNPPAQNEVQRGATVNFYCDSSISVQDREPRDNGTPRSTPSAGSNESKWKNIFPELVKGLVPLLQTLLWFILSVIILKRFNSQIIGLIEALRKRIDAGDGVKAGPFELLGSLRPKTSQEQLADAEAATEEAIENNTEASDSACRDSSTTELKPEVVGRRDEKPIRPSSGRSMRSRYYMAEDLALRALQAEIGVPISRALQAGKGFSVDGFFVKDETPHIVEVKFRQSLHNPGDLKPVVERIFYKLKELGWGNARVVLVVVFDTVDQIDRVQARIQKVFRDVADVEVRCYSLEGLMIQFGIND